MHLGIHESCCGHAGSCMLWQLVDLQESWKGHCSGQTSYSVLIHLGPGGVGTSGGWNSDSTAQPGWLHHLYRDRFSLTV